MLKVMILTLSSMIGVPKICIRTDRNSRTNTGHSRNFAENIRFPADSLGLPNHFSMPTCYWSRL